jgi:hypothetical protein
MVRKRFAFLAVIDLTNTFQSFLHAKNSELLSSHIRERSAVARLSALIALL